MSTVVYAKLTSKRLAAEKGQSTTDKPPGISTYADMVTALVPAEVVAAQTLIVSLCTTVSASHVTTITSRAGLEAGFYGLMALSLILYVGSRITGGGVKFVRLDFVRMLIPPAAFVLWTMFLNISTLDGAVTSFAAPGRDVAAILGAIFVGGLAKLLGYQVDQAPAKTPVVKTPDAGPPDVNPPDK